MNVNLQKAIGALQIRDVFLRGNMAKVDDAFEPRYMPEVKGLATQFKHYVSKSEILELFDKKSKKTEHIFRVIIEVGARWVAPKVKKKGSVGKGALSVQLETLAAIEATYVAEYLLKSRIEQDCLDQFALNNASFHVWPFWREYLSSHCTRMNLPVVVLPLGNPTRNRVSEKNVSMNHKLPASQNLKKTTSSRRTNQ